MGRTPSYLSARVSDFRALNIAFLRRQGAHQPGFRGRLTWSRAGRVIASVTYAVQGDGLRLWYRYHPWGVEERVVEECIRIITTPTQFGGERHWFSCPGCHRRCAVLLGGSHFRCRRCQGARYDSQYESAQNRISEKRWRLRRQIDDRSAQAWPWGLDDGFPPRPR